MKGLKNGLLEYFLSVFIDNVLPLRGGHTRMMGWVEPQEVELQKNTGANKLLHIVTSKTAQSTLMLRIKCAGFKGLKITAADQI